MRPWEALYFLQHLPRFKHGRGSAPGRWTPLGELVLVAFQALPPEVEAAVTKIVRKRLWQRDVVETVDVLGADVWCIQSRVVHRRLCFMIRHFPRVQRWRKGRLPILIRFGRKLIVWNGHHRLFAARLLQRRLRCRVITIK